MSPYSRPRVSAHWGTDKRRSSTNPKLNLEVAATTASDTPDLSDVVAAVVSDGSAQITVAVSALSPSDTAPLASIVGQAIAVSPPAIRTQVSRVEIDTRASSLSATSPTTVVHEEEAVFPLVPSISPVSRTPLPSLAAAPVISVGDAPKQHDTLPCELAPGIETQQRSSNTAPPAAPGTGTGNGVVSAPLPTERAGLFPETAGTSATGAPETLGQRDQGMQEALSEDQTPLTRSDPQNAVGDAGATAAVFARAPSERPGATRAGTWLVPASLALTAGALSFTVALPIVQRLRSQPVAASDAVATSTPQDTLVHERDVQPSAGSVSPTRTPSVTRNDSSQPPEPTSREAPPGQVIPPDKALLTLRTNGVHSIFIDDEFVGRGPERTVTLSPGQHRIRTSLNGEDHMEVIEVPAARITLVTIDSNGK